MDGKKSQTDRKEKIMSYNFTLCGRICEALKETNPYDYDHETAFYDTMELLNAGDFKTIYDFLFSFVEDLSEDDRFIMFPTTSEVLEEIEQFEGFEYDVKIFCDGQSQLYFIDHTGTPFRSLSRNEDEILEEMKVAAPSLADEIDRHSAVWQIMFF